MTNDKHITEVPVVCPVYTRYCKENKPENFMHETYSGCFGCSQSRCENGTITATLTEEARKKIREWYTKQVIRAVENICFADSDNRDKFYKAITKALESEGR